MALKYPPFSSSAQLTRVAQHGSPLRKGMRGRAVGLVQAGLVQLGHKLPTSVRATGKADGIFGVETENAVMAYQAAHPLLKGDGIVGHRTLDHLDKALYKSSKPSPPQPPKAPPLPKTPEYEVGTGDPPLYIDPGAGAWRSKRPDLTYVALKADILQFLPVAAGVVGYDAALHMQHYFDNTGSEREIDLEGMLRDVPGAQQRFRAEVSEAQALVEKLPVGTHRIRSRRANRGQNRQSETRNWFFAIGDYFVWGDGQAEVTNTSGTRQYRLEFSYHFFDRYNWDGGKKVELYGITITDQFMGEFHRQGLAREFNCRATISRTFTWRPGSSIPSPQFSPPSEASR